MGVLSRLRNRPGLNAAAGFALAALAGLLLLGFVSGRMKDRAGGDAVPVLFATREIETGTVIEKEMVSVRGVPRAYSVPGSLAKTGDAVSRRALRFIGRGEPLTRSSVTGPGAGTVAARLPENTRAYTLLLRSGAGAGPDLRAGDRVDVLKTSGDPPRTTTLLRDRLILSVHPGGGDSAGPAGTVQLTLLVVPPEVELLAQAECEGEISTSLCPSEEGASKRSSGVP